MKPRKVILFKVNGEVVCEEHQDLTIEQVEKMKWVVAEEIEVAIFEVEVEYQDLPINLSEEMDVGAEGMYFWKSFEFKTVQGVYSDLIEGSDEYLDAILDGTIENHLNFFI